jgi:hypothetical protein
MPLHGAGVTVAMPIAAVTALRRQNIRGG